MRRLLVNLTVLGFSLAVCLALGELAARTFYSDVSTTAQHGDFFSRRWYAENPAQVNSLGFWEREVTSPPPEDLYRIAVVGDSITYGQGLLAEARMTNLLQERLDPTATEIEVLNFGRPGAETVDQLEFLHTAVLPVEPDFVLLQWYLNDVEGHDKSGRPRGHRLVPSDRLHEIFWRRSALYVAAHIAYNNTRRSLSAGPTYADYMSARFADPASQDLADYLATLSTFIEGARSADAKIGMLLYPRVPDYRDGYYPHGYLHDHILRACAAHEIICVDLRDALFAVGDNAALAVNRLDAHPSALANRIMADAVLTAFEAHWIAQKDARSTP
jgi:lysophospholipase L1-like esterase